MDFVVAVVSSASIDSPWVQKELDLASNREMGERQVVVLPILLDDVKLPGFLKGKLYVDFRAKDSYQEGLSKMINRLGPRTAPADLSSGNMVIKPYLCIVTSYHSYLRVPQSELDQLGIRDKITEYSYKDTLYVYLEEDSDLVAFIEAKQRNHGNDYDVEKDSFTVYVDEFPF